MKPSQLAQSVHPLTAGGSVACPAQVLVVDAQGGPANVLMDTVGLLLERDISVTSVDTQADAVRALEFYDFDLVVVGHSPRRPIQLTVVPPLHEQAPEAPIVVVGRNLSRRHQYFARTSGAHEVLDLPERAADLKTLTARLADRYLSPMACVCDSCV